MFNTIIIRIFLIDGNFENKKWFFIDVIHFLSNNQIKYIIYNIYMFSRLNTLSQSQWEINGLIKYQQLYNKNFNMWLLKGHNAL